MDAALLQLLLAVVAYQLSDKDEQRVPASCWMTQPTVNLSTDIRTTMTVMKIPVCVMCNAQLLFIYTVIPENLPLSFL